MSLTSEFESSRVHRMPRMPGMEVLVKKYPALAGSELLVLCSTQAQYLLHVLFLGIQNPHFGFM